MELLRIKFEAPGKGHYIADVPCSSREMLDDLDPGAFINTIAEQVRVQNNLPPETVLIVKSKEWQP